jgi:CubicO group peptidase (beta-lactamase class C family)
MEMPELNDRVRRVLEGLVASGTEIGLQTAAYVDGELVVDAWAGVADEATGRPVDGGTLFTSWSTTKGFVATCLHLLADGGLVDYDEPVAHYWPEFAVHGKGAVTVRHALTHRAGIPQMPDGVTPEMMADWEAMCAAIAALRPLRAPGATVAYHAWTYGWLIGEIVRRVDGRPLSQFASEELCAPLHITDFYLGIPKSVEGRVAPLKEEPLLPAAEMAPDSLARRVMPPNVTSAEVMNRSDLRRASVPGGGGIMSARAIARHYAMLACQGALDGTRVLSAYRVDAVRTLQSDTWDEVFGGRARRGLGYHLGGSARKGGDIAMGREGGEFGHGGRGGSLGFADPGRKLSFGLTKNLMRNDAEPRGSAAYLVAETIRAHLDRASSRRHRFGLAAKLLT